MYLVLFWIFAKIGAFTLGGGYAMLPLIEREIVDNKKWIDRPEFLDLVAIAQSAPGILAVNMAIFVGYKIKGTLGSVVATLGAVLPSFIIILLIALCFNIGKFRRIQPSLFINNLMLDKRNHGVPAAEVK